MCCLAAFAGAPILFAYDPSVTAFYPRCVFHSLTGWQCPGCGTTRALHQLLHGHFRDAFRFNAMLFVFAPFLATAAAKPEWFRRAWVGWTALMLVVGWWILRNLAHL